MTNELNHVQKATKHAKKEHATLNHSNLIENKLHPIMCFQFLDSRMNDKRQNFFVLYSFLCRTLHVNQENLFELQQNKINAVKYINLSKTDN